MQTDAYLWGLFGTIAGVVVAIVLFVLALRFVARARRGNRRVREARHDPHAAGGHGDRRTAAAAEDRRDIGQW